MLICAKYVLNSIQFLSFIVGNTWKNNEAMNPNERRKRKLESDVQAQKRCCLENVIGDGSDMQNKASTGANAHVGSNNGTF